MGDHTALSQLEQRSKEIRESHNSGNIDDNDEDEEKPNASVITYPILRRLKVNSKIGFMAQIPVHYHQ